MNEIYYAQFAEYADIEYVSLMHARQNESLDGWYSRVQITQLSR